MPDADESWADLVVPDDISSLGADVAAYRRELRQARSARLVRRVGGRGPLFAMVGAAVFASLIALMLTVMAPGAVVRPRAAAPLAQPTAAEGTIGGLLPDTVLTGPDGPVDSRSPVLRPAVFALVPKGCGCPTLLDGIAGAAFSERLPLAVVVAATSDSSTAAAVDSLDRGTTTLYLDPRGTLALAMTGSIPASSHDAVATVVVIDRDGTIYDIEPNVTDAASTSLDATLQSMLLAR